MAYLITTTGKKKSVKPKNTMFSLKEISDLIGGQIKPTFIGNYWIFQNEDLFDKPNEMVSDLVKTPIYGDVLICRDKELSSTFFFPKDVIDKIVGQVVQTEMLKVEKDLIDLKLKNLPEDERTQFIDTNNRMVFDTTYNTLFARDLYFDQIYENFVLFNDGSNYVNVPKEKQFDFMVNMKQFYLDKEEYEKVQILTDYIDFLIKNM